nr:glycine cleavage system H protein, mitochondrial [Leptinotarsa decemlineata]
MALPRFFVRATNLVKTTPVFSHSCKVIPRFFNTSNCAFAERLYTDKHEWIEVNDKIATVGISQYAQEALGDVVYAQLPDVNTELKQKDECGALESVKAASEIYSPISGKVVEKNVGVEDTPSLINTSCYDKGWLFKVQLDNETELSKLMSEVQYTEFLKTEQDH